MKKRKPLLAGNWKMYKTCEEAKSLAQAIVDGCKDITGVDIAIFPAFTCLYVVQNVIKNTNIDLGAQDMFWEKEGAYTGEISPIMLKNVGCKFVIVGHSERRIHFNETDENVNKKIKAAILEGLTPIVCVGERLDEREKGQAFCVVADQISEGFAGFTKENMLKTVIAYEPVWAIGTGKTATPQIAQEMHSYIRKIIAGVTSSNIAEKIRIIYGGSVKPDNIRGLLNEQDIDGALVGGASLSSESFVSIIKY
jgi:triosephosphate isomerase